MVLRRGCGAGAGLSRGDICKYKCPAGRGIDVVKGPQILAIDCYAGTWQCRYMIAHLIVLYMAMLINCYIKHIL